MKKIDIMRISVIVLALCAFLFSDSFFKNFSVKKTILDEVKLKKMPNSKDAIAIMVEQEDGTYKESDSDVWAIDGYKYNETLSGCIDEKGNEIENVLSYDYSKNIATMKINKRGYCYLYFSKDKSVYYQVKKDFLNNDGVNLLSNTEDDRYPVYYYTGNITNNNVIYGGYCWKMVRTTDTGGVKLLYNGIPTDGVCNNSGTDSQIGTSTFNAQDSLAYAGYMYNSVYAYSTHTYQTIISPFIKKDVPNTTYYYGDTITYDENEQIYQLNNLDNSAVSTYKWRDNYKNLIGLYTCLSSTSASCETVYYVASGDATYMYYYAISDGKYADDYTIKLSPSVKDNEDDTYTLEGSVDLTKVEYAKNYNTYKNYYYCSDLVSDTCSDMFKVLSVTSSALGGINMSNVFKYGNSFEYKDGMYILKDNVEFWDWQTNYKTLNNNHYTCFNSEGICESINYLYYAGNSTVRYITIKDGKSIEDAINEMLYADEVNKTDSKIKVVIDKWYEDSILDKKDFLGNYYSDYLENTIWCNNRQITALGGWNPNGGNITSTSLTYNYYTLECENKTDQFTLKEEFGGVAGYGNNALDYPIALLSYKEVSLADANGYVFKDKYWLLSPFSFFSHYLTQSAVMTMYGGLSGYAAGTSFGVRPSVSLSINVEITDGTGEIESPYIIKLVK